MASPEDLFKKRVFWRHQFQGKVEYDMESKEKFLAPIFEALDEHGALGNVIVDVGSGPVGVLEFVPPREGRKTILVDIAADRETYEDSIQLAYDIDRISDIESRQTRSFLERIARFLKVESIEQNQQQVDTMIFSEVLNYVDYKSVLREAIKYIKPGGRLIIWNAPGRTFDIGGGEAGQRILSPGAPKGNNEVIEHLKTIGCEIEYSMFSDDSPDPDQATMVVLARKK